MKKRDQLLIGLVLIVLLAFFAWSFKQTSNADYYKWQYQGAINMSDRMTEGRQFEKK